MEITALKRLYGGEVSLSAPGETYSFSVVANAGGNVGKGIQIHNLGAGAVRFCINKDIEDTDPQLSAGGVGYDVAATFRADNIRIVSVSFKAIAAADVLFTIW